MPRVCFVIMPFSATASCSEAEWTSIFESLFKPSIEQTGLDYECRRSTATRGNIVAGVIRDLNEADIVLADLTDQNPNVFYELGVRHSLKTRTIIVAQSSNFVPFDLQQYAYHIYDWRTPEGQAVFAERIRALLIEIDSSPDRPDNPVADFLEPPRQSLAATNTTPQGFDDLRMRQSSSEGHPESRSQMWNINVQAPATMFNVSAVTWSPRVAIHPVNPLGQIAGGENRVLQLRVEWARGEEQPEELIDTYQRRFPYSRPRDPGSDWNPLYVTFETATREIWAAATYYKVEEHSKGFPETNQYPGFAPFDWIRGR